MKLPVEQRRRLVVPDRPFSRQQFVDHDGQRVLVGSGIHVEPSALFGRYVVERSEHLGRTRHLADFGHGRRYPKVRDLDLAVGVQQHVFGFQIAMDDLSLLQRRECLDHAGNDVPNLGHRQGLAQRHPAAQSAAGHVFHHQIRPPVRDPMIEYANNVGMVELGEQARLTVEPQPEFRFTRPLGEQQELDGHLFIGAVVASQEDFAHAALAELFRKGVVRQVWSTGSISTLAHTASR